MIYIRWGLLGALKLLCICGVCFYQFQEGSVTASAKTTKAAEAARDEEAESDAEEDTGEGQEEEESNDEDPEEEEDEAEVALSDKNEVAAKRAAPTKRGKVKAEDDDDVDEFVCVKRLQKVWRSFHT